MSGAWRGHSFPQSGKYRPLPSSSLSLVTEPGFELGELPHRMKTNALSFPLMTGEFGFFNGLSLEVSSTVLTRLIFPPEKLLFLDFILSSFPISPTSFVLFPPLSSSLYLFHVCLWNSGFCPHLFLGWRFLSSFRSQITSAVILWRSLKSQWF